MSVFRYLLFLLIIIPWPLYAQDTVFVQKHWFESPVRNVFKAEEKIYVKTGDGLFALEKKGWEKINLTFGKSYVFFNNGFFESEFIPEEFIKETSNIAYLIPQKSLVNCTIVEHNNHLFVSVGGSLFEYEIRPHFTILYPNTSIRHVYMDENIKVISTYSGIFVNDTLRQGFPPYSNGHFVHIKGQYYICTDDLYRIISRDSVRLIKSGQNVFAGHSRKLIEWQDKVYSLNTNSINELQAQYNLYPIHKGFDYSDLENFDSLLYFSTYEGILFSFDGSEVRKIAEVGARIRELFAGDNWLYLAADNGVFKIQSHPGSKLTKIFRKPFCVDIEQDRFKNLWIATENGLFIIPNSAGKAVPIVTDVEFNRYAMTYYNDQVYAGSINGLYFFDIYTIEKSFLPVYYQKVADQTTLFWKNFIIKFILIVLPILFVSGWLIRRVFLKRKIAVQQKPESYNLEQIKRDVILYKIVSVEALAEHYKTNPVQLNRQFKHFGTTPGKFLKKVKISWAKTLLRQGMELGDIAKTIGYSIRLLKKELHKEL
jgi:AraC-like DNA-binding protein